MEKALGETMRPLQIAILIVGSRGDVQPIVAIAMHMQRKYNHQIRVATHVDFRNLVIEAGLDFYPLGGDPKILVQYMAENNGCILPLRFSRISIYRKQLRAIINSVLPACTEPSILNPSFRAQAILANPMAYGHVHIAEYLNVPFHLISAIPWTPTSEILHPCLRIKGLDNKMTYKLVDVFMWLSSGSLLNKLRKDQLKLDPLPLLSSFIDSNVSATYTWSPHLVPKPKDWGENVDVTGFCFLDQAHDFKPPLGLLSWLESGQPPIHIGFGSLDPERTTEIIIEALKLTGQRGIISKGWAGLGGESTEFPDHIYVLDEIPHDWLFPRCSGVINHGGVGTVAASLRAGCPTAVVHACSDQELWGEIVHSNGAGPAPIHISQISLQTMVQCILCLIKPEVKERAIQLSEWLQQESAIEAAVRSIHKHLDKSFKTNDYCKNDPSMPVHWDRVYCCFVFACVFMRELLT
ncbi:sterol 3-beta-glucosyltransferase UGT80A2 isoform X2 [Selaginella moellendorffii]|uniref:sterol 3-beta-glucosyltransferase UGT80A2 isoform X2 n=1 Tax=Selaginella moellendorffii TaxID=88036 RepID=UPI000D1C8421|nr:sterol 3-beta-glucosyltransferase UGT80A2 isoform X2 [Selaginella moellendorffii]|eukprot:XP_024539999.1 sterol 3-beta-glucosyltransferase UGT80A2 isoform X2 [Selaginella moellendorffii]